MKDLIRIKEIERKHFEQVKELLVDLQKYIIEIDKYNLNILSKEYKEKYFDYMINDCNSNQGKVFLAVKNNKVLGLVAGYIEKYNVRDKLDYTCPKKGIVSELIVAKNARQDGIGTKLLLYIQNYFKSIECEYVQIDVFAYNNMAKEFYYKNGYEDRMITVFKKI